MKPSNYEKGFLHWLIQNFENKLWLWENRWLSLNSRMVMIKVVLKGIIVYWMHLFHFLMSIIHKINSTIIDSLWVVSGCKNKLHLSKLDSICTPIDGGWGIKHTHTFNLVLLIKNLWRAFKCLGI